MTVPRVRHWPLTVLAFLPLLESSPLGAQAPGNDARLRCEVYCSRDTSRTGQARISWIGPQMPLGPKAIRDRPADVSETVETTVYKRGFDKNLYTSLEARAGTARGAKFRFQAKQSRTLPGLDLKVTKFARPKLTTEQRRALERPAALRSPAPAAVAAQETAVEVQGLKPGFKYQWRVRFKGPSGEQLTGVVTCIAPTCPADLKE